MHFLHVWNALVERQTTRALDRILILAVLTDMFIADVFELDEAERLESVLGHQDYIPLSIFTSNVHCAQNPGNKIAWQTPAPGVPKLRVNFGLARRCPSGLTFDPSDANCVGSIGDYYPRFVLVPHHVSREVSVLTLQVPGESDIYVWQNSQPVEHDSSSVGHTLQTCYLLQGSRQGLPKLAWFAGAKFYAKDHGDSRLSLEVGEPVLYTTYRPESDDRSEPATVLGQLIDIHRTVMIDYGTKPFKISDGLR